MVKCSKCGSQIADNEKFCGECGTPRPVEAQPTPPNEEAMELKPAPPVQSAAVPKLPKFPSKKIEINRNLLIVILLVFLLTISCSCFYIIDDIRNYGPIHRFIFNLLLDLGLVSF